METIFELCVNAVLCRSPFVIVVNDDPLFRAATGIILTSFGFTPVLAENDLDAIDKFMPNRGKVAFVIMSVDMPGVDWLDVIRKMKQMDHDVKIIMIGDGWDKRFFTSEMDAFLVKPYAVAELRAAIQYVFK